MDISLEAAKGDIAAIPMVPFCSFSVETVAYLGQFLS
jgi:hypothetical protein